MECRAIKAKELLFSKFNDFSQATLFKLKGASLNCCMPKISSTSTTYQNYLAIVFSLIIQLYNNLYKLSSISTHSKTTFPPKQRYYSLNFIFLFLQFPKYIHTLIIIQNLRIQQDNMAGLTKETYDYMFKVIVIGDSGVGKTNLILRFSDKNFNNNYVATIGVDFKIKTITIGDKRVRLQLWDTAGQERFRTITQTYYKGAAGIILTYSIDDRKTFENITKWMKQIKEKTPPHVQKLIVANKCDLESERKVQYEQGQNLAKQLSDDTCKVQFIEVSAKSGKNVMQAFSKISLQIKQYVEANQTMAPKSSVIRIQKESSKPNSCKC